MCTSRKPTRLQITKIIRGAYSPLPPSRSPELRGLIASLLVLDARKRPSINEVLAAPLLRARITRFLDQTLQVRSSAHLRAGVCLVPLGAGVCLLSAAAAAAGGVTAAHTHCVLPGPDSAVGSESVSIRHAQ